jgi:putative copper export protein/methionine-rich copper-binding protein CopC
VTSWGALIVVKQATVNYSSLIPLAIPGSRPTRFGLAFRLLALVSGFFLAFCWALPAFAKADLVRVEPAGNAVLASVPQQVTLTFSAAPDPHHSAVTVYGTDHKRIDDGNLRLAASDPNVLQVDLPSVPKGIYTVVWSSTAAADGTSSSGSFAFSVDPTQSSPNVLQQPQPAFALQTLDRAIPKWLGFLGIMTFVGALALRFLVWSPVVGRVLGSGVGDISLTRAADRRLLILAGAIVFFIPATIAQLASDVGSATKHPFAASFDVGLIGTYLGASGSGTLWAVRLALTALAAVIILPAAIRALAPKWLDSPRRVTAILALGLLCGMAELLTRTLPAVAPDDVPRAIFTSVLDWGHFLGSSVWVGGLVGLGVTASLLRRRGSGSSSLLSAIVFQFSMVATVCVGVMILTGLWTAWIHVGSLGVLFTTLYGQTLLVKLALVLALIGLGAINLFWLLPRMEAVRVANGSAQSLGAVLLTHFRRVIAVEVLVGFTILLVVPFLSSSSRNQAAALQAADLTQVAVAGDLPVTFKPSALQPGLVDYDITLPVRDATRVTLAFASSELKVPETTVVAVARGDGRYRASGLYTPMIGRWQLRVLVRQPGKAEQAALFDLPIKAEPVPAPKLPPPTVQSSTWAWGIAEVIGVVLVLTGARLFSRRLTTSRVRFAASQFRASGDHSATRAEGSPAGVAEGKTTH